MHNLNVTEKSKCLNNKKMDECVHRKQMLLLPAKVNWDITTEQKTR
jgi:hypothetical protein